MFLILRPLPSFNILRLIPCIPVTQLDWRKRFSQFVVESYAKPVPFMGAGGSVNLDSGSYSLGSKTGKNFGNI